MRLISHLEPSIIKHVFSVIKIELQRNKYYAKSSYLQNGRGDIRVCNLFPEWVTYSSALKEQKFEERLLDGFKKVQMGRRRSGVNEACAVFMTDVDSDKIRCVQRKTCGDEEDECGWFHQDCIRVKDMDKTQQWSAYTCPQSSNWLQI